MANQQIEAGLTCLPLLVCWFTSRIARKLCRNIYEIFGRARTDIGTPPHGWRSIKL